LFSGGENDGASAARMVFVFYISNVLNVIPIQKFCVDEIATQKKRRFRYKKNISPKPKHVCGIVGDARRDGDGDAARGAFGERER
jgi:hypothetical protein